MPSLRAGDRRPASASASRGQRARRPSTPRTAAGPLSPEELRALHAWWRAANYLSVGQIYLLDNPLLARPLAKDDVKPRLLGPVRGYKEEGTATTPFDMAVLNDLDRYHLVADVIDRVPRLSALAAYARQRARDLRGAHREYIALHGEDPPDRLPCSPRPSARTALRRYSSSKSAHSAAAGLRVWSPSVSTATPTRSGTSACGFPFSK